MRSWLPLIVLALAGLLVLLTGGWVGLSSLGVSWAVVPWSTEGPAGPGGPGDRGPVLVAPPVSLAGGASRGAGWEYTPSPTSTPWPTFTPVPTVAPTVTPRPTATPAPTFTPVPRSTAAPAEVFMGNLDVTPVGGSDGGGDAGAGDGSPVPTVVAPTPTPYGAMGSAPVRFVKQSFFVTQVGEVPEYLRRGEFEKVPAPLRVVGEDSPYLVWFALFDLAGAPEDFVMEGLLRWWEESPGVPSLLVYEGRVRLSQDETLFYHGIGSESGGVWPSGTYRVEFVDNRGRLVVDWTFEVV